jgi:aldehyde dehydrogenase (NAD+)
MPQTTELSFDLLPEVRRFLALSPVPAVIGWRDVTAASGATFRTFDPGSAMLLSEVTALQAEDVDAGVQAARRAFAGDWGKPAQSGTRLQWMRRLADAVEQRRAEFAQIESLDAGKLIGQAGKDVDGFIATLRYFAGLASELPLRQTLEVSGHEAWVTRQPWGACGFIVPWNFPLLLVGWGIGPALAAGNTVVVKPAEDTSLSALYLARVARDIGFPDGVINVVPGHGEAAGAALAGHPGLRRMSFTGSPEVGRLVARACGHNLVPCKLELGGKGAAVIFDDVDISATATQLADAITFHAGQVCCDATRWLVHRSVHDEFVDAVSQRLREVRIGHPMEAGSQMGPVVNARQAQRVLGYLDRGRAEGAKLLMAGGAAAVSGYEGHYVKPALLGGSLDNIAARDEIFGPVAYISAFGDEAQAVRMANDTDYGLANSVWSQDLQRAGRVAEAMEAGNSWINAHNVFPNGVPYAGVKRSGMGGGVNSVETLLDYLRPQSMVRPTA